MFDAHPPFQIDGNFGSTSGIDEMLLQSDQRYRDRPGDAEDRYYIDLLPALPSAWPEGSIHGLRARGGFTVDEDWKGGALVRAKLTSYAGVSTRLRYKGKTQPLTLRPGQAIDITTQNGMLQISAPHAAGALARVRR